MKFSLSTHWNAGRHDTGESLVDEITELGFTHIELGYNTHNYHLEGIRHRLKQGTIAISSLHNYCPVPAGIGIGHPELYTLADPKEKNRELAVIHTTKTLEAAADLGAEIVVMHCGNVMMRRYTPKLEKLIASRKRYTDKYERLKMKSSIVREKKVRKQFDHLLFGLERLLSVAARLNVRIGFENLPSWEAIPNEQEVGVLLRTFKSDHLRYWHDTGHGQIREELGYSSQIEIIRMYNDQLGGMHVHDVQPPLRDHYMPPGGQVNFPAIAALVQQPVPLVLEPSSKIPADQVASGLKYMQNAWNEASPDA